MGKIKGTIVVDTQRCKGCGVCLTACPLQILTLSDEVNGKGYSYAIFKDSESCTGCASCGMICPDSCITVYRKKME